MYEEAQKKQKKRLQQRCFGSLAAGAELQVHEGDRGSAEDHSSVLFP